MESDISPFFRNRAGGNRMGFTVEKLIVRNTWDVVNEAEGKITRDEIRMIEVDALVDTGSHFCGLHREQIERLGLTRYHETPVYTGNGIRRSRIYSPGPEFELLGRSTFLDVMEIPDSSPAIIGVILLESLLLTVDPVAQHVVPHERQTHWMLHHVVA